MFLLPIGLYQSYNQIYDKIGVLIELIPERGVAFHQNRPPIRQGVLFKD